MPTLAPQSEALIPLAIWLEGQRPLTQEQLVLLTRQLAIHLVALHEQGSLHGHLTIDCVAVSGNDSGPGCWIRRPQSRRG